MPYYFVADGIHTKKLCSTHSLSEVQFYTFFCVFELHLGLGATYNVYLRPIGKRVIDSY